MREAERWVDQLDRFQSHHFPRDTLEISFSRSSGPGGQHVNKTSSKATVRMPLSATSATPKTDLVPPYVVTNLRTASSPLYVANPPSLLVSSSAMRSQAQNLDLCFEKLKAAIVQAARKGIVGETSERQKQRVDELEKREQRKMRNVKEKRKDVKGGRRAAKNFE